MTIEFFSNPMSRGRIVHWMLEELGEPYETKWIPYGPNGHKGEEFLKINPMGKVPALRHEGRVVTEAPAIITYLSLAFPDGGLGPREGELADFMRWMFFAAGPLEQAVTANALGWVVPADKQGTVGYGSLDTTVETLDGMLSKQPYVCGERFTGADVYLGSHVVWGLMGKTLPERRSFAEYAKRMAERPANVKSREICDQKLAEWQSAGG